MNDGSVLVQTENWKSKCEVYCAMLCYTLQAALLEG